MKKKSTVPRKAKQRKRNTKNSGEVIAVTGINGFLGSSVVRLLEADNKFARVIGLDKKKPRFPAKKMKFYRVNLTESLADAKIAEIFKKEKVSVVVHCAFPITPLHDSSKAHELQSIGTMYLLNACAEQRIRKFILASTTDVYGALPTNPNYLTEKHPAQGGAKSRFIRDKIDAENQVLKFGERRPETCVTILRPCTVLGPHIHNFKTRVAQRPVAFTLLGYDPLMQFVHEDDLLKAFNIVLDTDHRGIFNIVGHGVLPLSKVLQLTGNVTVPVPSSIMYPLTRLMWYFDIFPGPASHLDFLRYLCVADGSKALKELGFKARYSSRDALLSFIGAERLRKVHLLDEEVA